MAGPLEFAEEFAAAEASVFTGATLSGSMLTWALANTEDRFTPVEKLAPHYLYFMRGNTSRDGDPHDVPAAEVSAQNARTSADFPKSARVLSIPTNLKTEHAPFRVRKNRALRGCGETLA